ncbi:KH domain-containing protein [Alicyclobacillus cycloheptanicus]|jgi:predicted RNA-binding protein YlqC (UPF0109 family)|uniref:RNA-binding protein KhpA n=1 Tax=Alicyclobacillus cycloheptanicus TaxID=1457 RepID=A0ABT9XMJ1_9BACL|nr:KH domain-containing protein [Alicyclobacillus cycloheptanicus]MDQ0191534.1 putative RNA-binding protein YlqC (UPF0109 family) [Alicyclobacillus cycloheptanicus]WDM01431.1 KH domain-containing protein [Alicyclobacillus cycloheptanicus]
MKELVVFLAQSLVEHPEAVSVTEETRGDVVVYHLSVDPADLGRIIGRQGRIAKAMRNVISAAAYRKNQRVVLEIAEP